VDLFNRGPADLVIVLPFTSKAKGVRCHVVVDPPEAGLRQRSFIKCEDLRSIAKERLLERWGGVPSDTMAEVEDQVRILLGL
jgi:mRNA interferase MazF